MWPAAVKRRASTPIPAASSTSSTSPRNTGRTGWALDPARGRPDVSVEGSPDRPGGVVVIDTQTRRPLGRIDTDAPGPHWFAIDPTGRTGCATNKEAPFASVVDLERGILTAKVEVPGSEGLAVAGHWNPGHRHPDGVRVSTSCPRGTSSCRCT